MDGTIMNRDHLGMVLFFVLIILIPPVYADTYIFGVIDGYVARSVTSESLPVLVSGAGTAVDNTSNTGIIRLRSADSNTTDTFNYHAKYEMIIDTGTSLPDDFVPTSARLDVYFYDAADTSLGTPSLGITGANPYSSTSIQRLDYNKSTSVLYSDSYLSPAATTWGNWSFNAAGLAGISTTGITAFQMRLSWDILQTTTGLTWKPYQNRSTAYPRTAEYVAKPPLLTVWGMSPPVAAFSCTPTELIWGNETVCTDASTNTPTSWNWSWGDYNFSTVQNPVKRYNWTGKFTISLNATNAGGSDIEEKIDYINVSWPAIPVTPPSGPICYFMNFTGVSVNNATWEANTTEGKIGVLGNQTNQSAQIYYCFSGITTAPTCCIPTTTAGSPGIPNLPAGPVNLDYIWPVLLGGLILYLVVKRT